MFCENQLRLRRKYGPRSAKKPVAALSGRPGTCAAAAARPPPCTRAPDWQPDPGPALSLSPVRCPNDSDSPSATIFACTWTCTVRRRGVVWTVCWGPDRPGPVTGYGDGHRLGQHGPCRHGARVRRPALRAWIDSAGSCSVRFPCGGKLERRLGRDMDAL